MSLRRVVILLLLPLGVWAHARYSEAQLFEAYLTGDMQVWKEYIDHSTFDALSVEEQKRLVYYEYGYAAALLDIDKRAAKPYIRRFGEHIEALSGELPPVLVHIYTAAYQTYDLAVTPRAIMKHKDLIFRHAAQALQTDPEHPLAWGIQANVHFYAPRVMGGNKRLAMREYETADSLFAAHEAEHELDWTYVAQSLSLAQCYDKLGMTDRAISQAEKILAHWPRFAYIKQYINKLKKENAKNN